MALKRSKDGAEARSFAELTDRIGDEPLWIPLLEREQVASWSCELEREPLWSTA